ncbi:MAG TPA: transcription-repair coupling factor [Clostridia bacterium]|nr:transcription-repair coupling factor [Clostridia bacterium]
MDKFLKQVDSLPRFSELLEKIKNQKDPIIISGLSEVGKAEILSLINSTLQERKKPICIITYNEIQARELVKNINALIRSEENDNNSIIYFPKREISAYEFISESKDLPYKRIEILNQIRNKKVEILVTTIETIMQKMILPENLYNNNLKFKIGDIYKIDDLKQKLIKLGYYRNEIIDGRGQFCIRGGILDISVKDNSGIRIEFWGDDVDSIREFDITTQRSTKMLEEVEIFPSHEMILETDLEKVCKTILEKNYKDKNEIEKDIEQIRSGNYLNKIDKYFNSFYINNGNLTKYLSKFTIFIDEKVKISQRIENIIKENNSLIKILVEKNRSIPDSISNISEYKFNLDCIENVFLEKNDIPSKEIHKLLKNEDDEYNYSNIKFNNIKESMYKKTTKKRRQTDEFKQSERVVFADLSIGDYVVHKVHGIGQYIGVNTIKANDVTKDYIKIKYKNEDILYIPTDSLDSVRKYIGGEKTPKIYKLGGKDWLNTKTKVKNNLREVAKELIEIYAKRKKITGYAFSKDTPWQQQFESSFQYSETEDQLRCIEEVKKDMENSKPMDRLLCGDVGYGKTEVAIRAAFKAVMDQKQVAYLVPTTVLANQQFEEFRKRMQEYPIRVELLSRFRTAKQQQEIIRKLNLGEIDIIVGTHRILSKDVEFKDLGLLIIDEEHRFGVKDKEKIKGFKTNVDVLTMTATPIPRTLHMSIVGVRDMSVIYEPPYNRKPVQTYVLEQDDEVVKEAITKELERGGQVFYLYNNVEQIAKKSNEISNLVPESEVAYAHGQMTGRAIEDIMNDFVNKKINVLVCTTILESGIDIPNANTILVENADRLGLAQLYQIRGRVGRSDKQAYAYIMYKRDKMISEIAEKRLKAIKEFTELGSGFKIAMRDLEIRGAGSLLGEVQHGHMEQVGYDTYCNLLDEVIKEMQGIEFEVEQDIQIDLNVSSYIPDDFISDGKQKIDIYQDIAIAKTEDNIQNVIDEIIDRYGSIPKEVENLIEIARIKQLCRKKGIVKLVQRNENIIIYLDKKFNTDKIPELIKEYGTRIRFSQSLQPYITLKLLFLNDKNIIQEIKNFFKIF